MVQMYISECIGNYWVNFDTTIRFNRCGARPTGGTPVELLQSYGQQYKSNILPQYQRDTFGTIFECFSDRIYAESQLNNLKCLVELLFVKKNLHRCKYIVIKKLITISFNNVPKANRDKFKHLNSYSIYCE